MRNGVILLLALVLLVASPAVGLAAADPSALWHIVGEQCVPDQLAHADPAPCAAVDPNAGWAVLKDTVGATQFLLIATQRTSGIEDPAVLAPGAPNYFAAAWRARSFVNERAGSKVPRGWMSLAINSAFARTQDQLHIHVDCLSPDVHAALSEHGAAVGPGWAPFPVPLAGHQYDAISVGGRDLDAVNPFVLLADGEPGAREDMAGRTLVVAGSVDANGQPGFIVLTDHVDAAAGDMAAGEQLQDHDFCPQLAAASPGK